MTRSLVPLLIALVIISVADCAPLKSGGLLSGNMVYEDEVSVKLVDLRTYQHPNVTVEATSFECVDNSSQSTCSAFIYPEENVLNDLDSLCTDSNFLVGCSLWYHCLDTNSTAGYCDPFVLLASTCADMPMASGCKPYNQLCGGGSEVEQCIEMAAIPNVLLTLNVTDTALLLCAESSDSPGAVDAQQHEELCATCTGRAACVDPLGTLSTLCTVGPGEGEDACRPFELMCNSSGAIDAFSGLCGHKAGPQSEFLSKEDAVKEVVAMCESHPMDGCEQCKAEDDCEDPWAAIAMCCWSMPGMSGCEGFLEMCSKDSDVIAQYPELCSPPSL